MAGWLAFTPPASGGPVKVFVLCGQSNMEGKGAVALLERQLAAPGTRELFAPLKPDGHWLVRDDVFVQFLNRRGRLTVGFGSPKCIGPELGFGLVVGDHYDEPVLLIKAAWGGRSLYRDFRPPSAGLPPAEVLARDLERARKKKPETTLEEIRQSYGRAYRDTVKEVRETLAHLGELFPELAGATPELAGFVWFQGWNDMINAEYTAAYAENMAAFIRDIRKDLGAPKLPFVIGQMGVGGTAGDANPKREAFKEAQAAPARLPEFRGNVAVVKTDVFWDQEADAVYRKGWRQHLEEWNQVGSNYPFHYLGSVKTFLAIGRAFGRAVLDLQPAR